MRRFFCIVALFALSACRVDVTQTIDVTQTDREVITYRETFDDEAFAATTRLGGASAFGFDAAKADGWNVRGSSGPDRHTFVFQQWFRAGDSERGLTHLAYDSAEATPNDAFLLGPTAFIGVPITASASAGRVVTIPPLLRPSDTLTENGRKNAAFQLANARVNAAAVDSIVHVQIQLRDAAGLHQINPSFAEAKTFTPSGTTTVQVGQPWRLSPLLAFWRFEGIYGVFDFEHNSPPLCSAEPKYRKAWMSGVGVYANGAAMTEQLMDNALELADSWIAKHPVECPEPKKETL